MVTAALALLLAGGVLLPLAGLFADMGEELALERRRVEAYRRVAARAAALPQERAEIEAAADPADYLRGASDALAGAALQAHLAALVQAAGGTVASSQTLARQGTAGAAPVPVTVRLAASVGPAALRDLLHAVEAGRPRLLAERLTVRAADPAGTRLDLVVDVRGWRLP